MRVKRYSAKTEYEAMEQIKKDHGTDAYILHTKQVKSGGFFGFMKKPTVEILVGIEDEKPKDKELELLIRENASTKQELDDIKKSLAKISEDIRARGEEDRRRAEKERRQRELKMEEQKKRDLKTAETAQKFETEDLEYIENIEETEIIKESPLKSEFIIEAAEDIITEEPKKEVKREHKREIKREQKREAKKEQSHIETSAMIPLTEEAEKIKLKLKIQNGGNILSDGSGQDADEKKTSAHNDEKVEINPWAQKEAAIRKKLINKGVGYELADSLIEQVRLQLKEQNHDEDKYEKLLKIAIKNALGFPFKINKDENKRRVFFFVGPTGVGKTTTIAKIAAKLSFIEGKDVALITADTFRIAAVEQLKTYGNILSIPIDVVYKPIELEEALRKHEDCDFVLVDTAGRNHRDEKLREYVESYLNVAPDAEVFLLVSLTTSKADLYSIAESYSFLEDYKLIFTKIDETVSHGNILNVKIKTGKPTSFITNGQSVPDDIMLADPDEIARLIVGE